MGGSSKKSTVGYQYFLGMQLTFCHGIVSRLNQIIVGERPAWSGALEYTGTSEVSISVNAPDLFGGKKKEGGVQGKVDVCFGAADQQPNAYLQQALFFGGVTIPDYVPAFRGVTSLVLNQCYVAAGSPYPKPWWANLTRFPGEDWYPTTANITTGSGIDAADGSANGAHIVRETLLNEDWGLGYPVESIDDDSFRAVALTLYTEKFGLSYVLSGQGSVEDFLQEVISTVNGVIFTDRRTGKFILKLIRDDYIIGELLSFGPDNILEYTSFQRPQPAEMINEISIVYKRKEDYSDSASTFQDLASVVTQGAIISQTKQYPGIDSDEIAALVGMRELKQNSTPLAQVVFTANRQAWNLNPGEAFIFTWPERGIEQLIMRAMKIEYGELQDGRITITAIEDIFGLPDASYIVPQDPIWEDPVGDPTPLNPNDVEPIEIPHYLLAVNLDPGDYSAILEDSSFLIFMAQYPAISGPSYQLWTSLLPGDSNYSQRTTGTYTYHVALSEAITENDNNVNIAVTNFPPNFSNDFEPDVETGSLCLLKSEYDNTAELCILLGFDDTVSGNNTIKLGRGALDTIPRTFNISLGGTTIYFFENNWAFDPTEYSDGSQVFIKPLPQTGTGTLAISSATESIINMTGRQYLPSPPSYIRIYISNSSGLYPISIPGTTIDIWFYWNRTNRLTQTVPGVPPWFFNSINDVDPEENTEWWLYLYDEDKVDTLTPDFPANYTKLEKLGPAIKQYQWADEQEILEGSGLIPGTYRIHMPLEVDGEIIGPGTDYTPAINQTNIVYHGDETEFNVGYMDIGDDLITANNFTIILTVKPDAASSYTYVAKSAPTPAASDMVFYIGTAGSDLIVQSGPLSGSTRATFTSFTTAGVDQTIIVNAQRNVPSGGQMTITVWKDSEYIDAQVITPGYTDITAGSDWSLGHYYGPGIGQAPYSGFMKNVYMFNSIVTPLTFGITRKNNKVRFRLRTVRTDDAIEIESRDTFDWTFDRRGWTYNWDEYWDGGEA